MGKEGGCRKDVMESMYQWESGPAVYGAAIDRDIRKVEYIVPDLERAAHTLAVTR